ncbi:MAG: hypothetical protein QOG35_444 [Solirubrobacteraceae bacterium]|jgi:hypothetical protein|nr:hypothetical protein [Solirubrobacteraceae bacterium]
MTGEAPGVDDGGEYLHLANEFAEVRVRKVNTRNGVRLEIVAPKLGRRVQLDPVELESLTWQTPETFSSFLTTPFGPEPEVE